MERYRCVSGSGLRAIRDITHIMGVVLDAPMSTIEVQQVLRTGFGGSQGGDEMYGTSIYFFGVTLESLPFFGVSMEYFGVSNRLWVSLCLVHFGDTMEFSVHI